MFTHSRFPPFDRTLTLYVPFSLATFQSIHGLLVYAKVSRTHNTQHTVLLPK